VRNDELRLGAYGLRYLFPDPGVVMPFADGRSITMFRDRAATVGELARFSRHDARAYEELLADWDAIKDSQNGARYSPPTTAGAEVTRVLVEGGRAAGVATADGSEHRARRAVVSSIHVKHLPDVVGREALGETFVRGLARWRTGLTMFVTHYALDAEPRYRLEQ